MKAKRIEHTTADTGTAGLKLRCDYREEDFEYWPRPSELQLAELAARLARTEQVDPKQLVGEAWALYWESCRVIRMDYREVNNFLEQETKDHGVDECYREDGQQLIPTPKRYPVSFKAVELLLLPKLKGRTADRARIMRDFLFEDYVRSRRDRLTGQDGERQVPLMPEHLERMREESKAELDGLFGQLRTMTFDARYYALFAEHFLDWYQQRNGFIKSMVRSASARRSWERRRKLSQAKTGARPKHAALRQIMDSAGTPLDGSSGRKKS